MVMPESVRRDDEGGDGDHIDADIESSRNVAVGKGIEQSVRETWMLEGGIHIQLPGPAAAPAAATQGRRLMPEVEREFRENFARLTEALVELRESVKTNNSLTKQRIDMLQGQIEEGQRGQLPLWALYLALTLLGLIAACAVGGFVYLISG